MAGPDDRKHACRAIPLDMRDHAVSKQPQADRIRTVSARPRALASLIGLFGILVGLTACQTLRVGSDYDRAAAFASYHSFTWLARQNYGTGNPLVVEWARESIQSALERKGYRYATDLASAEFVVDFTIGARERVDVYAYPAPYAGPWHWYGRGWWGYPYWGAGVDVHRYREGALAIDIFDAKSHRPVWHGWARKPLTRVDLERSEEMIRKAVDSVLAQFPPQ
jgi:Domain of unknown function (DUF4136)